MIGKVVNNRMIFREQCSHEVKEDLPLKAFSSYKDDSESKVKRTEIGEGDAVETITYYSVLSP